MARAEADARRDLARVEGELNQVRTVQSLNGKHDADQPLEIHRLRAALRREQAVRDELEKEVDALKRSSQVLPSHALCVRERERKRETERGRHTHTHTQALSYTKPVLTPPSTTRSAHTPGASAGAMTEELRRESARARAFEVL